MANGTGTWVDPVRIRTAGAKTAGCLRDLEGLLNRFTGLQGDFQVAMHSKGIGNAVVSRLQDAWLSGKSLAEALHDVNEILLQNGVKIEAADEAGQARVNAGLDEGNFDAMEKINIDWPKG